MIIGPLSLLVIMLLSVGCAYPLKVKTAAAEQVKLVNQLRSTARAFGEAAEASLEQSMDLRKKQAEAADAYKLFQAGCFKQGSKSKCPPEAGLADHFEKIASATSEELKTMKGLIETQFKVLDIQLQLMARGAAIVQQYVDIDVTLDKDQMDDLKKVVRDIAGEIK